MSIVITTDVFCDGEDCSQWTHGETGPRTSAKYARAQARRAGWSCTIKGDYCPYCREKQQHERARRYRT